MRVEDKDLRNPEMEREVKLKENYCDRLIESWAKKKSVVGENFQNLAHNNINKARSLAMILENTEKHLARMSESVISSNFGLLPQNVMRTVFLGYGNSIRGEIFTEWPMQTMEDSIWYVKPVYEETLRDGVIDTVPHETATYRYSSEIEIESVGTSDGSTVNYTGSLTKTSVRSNKVFLIADDVLVAVDDGSGVFEDLVAGTLSTGVSSTINYTTGAYDITFSDVPDSGDSIQIRYLVDTEESGNHGELGALTLELESYRFKPDFHPLEIAFSKKAEFQLQTTLNTNTEDTLVKAAAEELKKSLDFRALREGYRLAKSNSIITYNADWKAAGASSAMAHLEIAPYMLSKAGTAVRKDLQRGGVTAVYGGPSAVEYLRHHPKFVEDTSSVEIGAFKAGTLGRYSIYEVPTSIVPDDELVTNWVNPNQPADSGLSIGVFLPMASTDRLTFKNRNTEFSIYSVEEIKTLNSKYCRRIKLNNLSTVLI